MFIEQSQRKAVYSAHKAEHQAVTYEQKVKISTNLGVLLLVKEGGLKP